jgi:formylglycine-generating enzyme required for sulfatase activity
VRRRSKIDKEGTVMQGIKRGSVFLLAALILFSCSRERFPEIEGMVYIPPGEFIMGSEDVDIGKIAKEFGLRKGGYYEDERPMRKEYLDGYYIDKYEVANSQYKEFIDDTGIEPPSTWKDGIYPDGKSDHPVNNVTWFDANHYCAWADKRRWKL